MTTARRRGERTLVDGTAPHGEDGQEIVLGFDLGAHQFTGSDGPAGHQMEQVRELEDEAAPVQSGDDRRAAGGHTDPGPQVPMPLLDRLVLAGLGRGSFGVADRPLECVVEDLRRQVFFFEAKCQ